jgi:hypothetical protein
VHWRALHHQAKKDLMSFRRALLKSTNFLALSGKRSFEGALTRTSPSGKKRLDVVPSSVAEVN